MKDNRARAAAPAPASKPLGPTAKTGRALQRRAPSSPHVAEQTELRERILAASIALIEEEGLARLSMREVARRAGVTHQAPYHHFTDREAILGEIAERGFRMLTERIESATRTVRPVVDRIVASGQAYVEFACAHPAHFRIMFRPELVNIENCPGARAEGDNAFSTVQRIAHEAVEAGLPAHPSEEALVAFLWSATHGLCCLLLDGPLSNTMPDTTREAQIGGVLGAMRAMLQASILCAGSDRPPSVSGAKHGTRNAGRKPRKRA